MGLFSIFKPAKSVVIVDGLSLYESAGLKGKVSPRNQLQMLRRLSRFSQREKVELITILTGSPLNKAPHGKKFEEMEVRYSKSEEVHSNYLVKTARSCGSNSVLVVGDDKAEKDALGSFVKTMRMSTFCKAFDIGSIDSDRDGNDRGNRDRNRNRRRPQRQQQQQAQQKAPEKKPKEQPAPKDKPRTNEDTINELIDLVD